MSSVVELINAKEDRKQRTKSRLRYRETPVGWLFASPWLIGFLAFTFIPMALSGYFSLTNYDLMSTPTWVGISNYQILFQDPSFIHALLHTLTMLGVLVPVNMLLSFSYGLAMDATARGQRLFRTLLYLPSLIPAVASGVLWSWLFNSDYGLINAFLGIFGIQGPLWFESIRWGMAALILIYMWGAGNASVLVFAALRGVPRELYEQAMVDGASVFWRVRYISWPMITPIIFFNIILTVIYCMQYFTQAYVITGTFIKFLSTFIYTFGFTDLDMGIASAASWVMLALTTLIVAFLFLTQRWWVHYDE